MKNAILIATALLSAQAGSSLSGAELLDAPGEGYRRMHSDAMMVDSSTRPVERPVYFKASLSDEQATTKPASALFDKKEPLRLQLSVSSPLE